MGLGTEPEIAFSTCFGAPFMVHRPLVYADLLRAKAKREHAEAQLAELELAEKRGEIILAADHKRVIFRLCRSIRDALVPIPDRMAPVVAAEDDPAKVHAELSREIRQVLEALSALANQGDDAERME